MACTQFTDRADFQSNIPTPHLILIRTTKANRRRTMTDQPDAVWHSIGDLFARPVPPFHLEVFDEHLNIWFQWAIDTGPADKDSSAHNEGSGVGDIIDQGIAKDTILLKDVIRDRDDRPVEWRIGIDGLE